MGYLLREGVSFCRVADRFVFLDIVDDRYFGLPDLAERAFASLLSNGRLSRAESAALCPLCRAGLLGKTSGTTKLRSCPVIEVARGSLLDDSRAASPVETAFALAHRLLAERQVRHRPLGELLGKLAEKKRPMSGSAAEVDKATRVAAAFRKAAVVLGTHDRCLPTSLAVVRRLLAHRVPADLVFGVKLRPFQAHCWVQLGDAVVNDRVDTVGLFTPILVL